MLAQFMTAKTKINYKPKLDREGELGKGTKTPAIIMNLLAVSN